MEGNKELQASVLEHFNCSEELKKMENDLQELILLTNSTTPQQGYSDFEREKVMEILNSNTKLLYKIRSINTIIEAYHK